MNITLPREIPSLYHIAMKQVMKQRIEYLSQFKGKQIVIVEEDKEIFKIIFRVAFDHPTISAVRIDDRSIILII